jgi:hypothetical protein
MEVGKEVSSLLNRISGFFNNINDCADLLILMKKYIYRSFSVICSLAVICNTVNSLAQSDIQTGDTISNGTAISKIRSGETVYYEPEHISLPKPQFYTGNWKQWSSTVNKSISIKHTAFKRQGNEVIYDALLSDKKDGFQEISRFKVTCSPPDNFWPNIKTSFFLIGFKKTYDEEWTVHRTLPKIIPEWKPDQSDPYKSGEQWLFVNLAENACYLTQ